MEEFREFLWPVPAPGSGYVLAEWRPIMHVPGQGRRPGNPALKIVKPPELGVRTYAPLVEEPALFRIFADTEPVPDACLAFANKYGLLGRICDADEMSALTCVWRRCGHPHEDLYSLTEDDIRFWVALILEFRQAVHLWDLATQNEQEELAQFVKWEKAAVRMVLPREESPYLPDVNVRQVGPTEVYFDPKDSTGAPLFSPGEVVGPTLFYLQGVLNQWIRETVSMWLCWDKQKQRSTLRLMPHSLWGAICAQFAQAVDGNRKYQRCPVCGKWFELSPGLNRANKLSCSAACRTRGYRLRQEQARAMFDAGKKPREIARELGSDLDTVRGWIEDHKG